MAKKDTEAAAAEVTAVPAESQEKAKTAKKLIYVGASVPGMRANTVFEGDMPEVLNVPFVRDCCIELSQFGKWAKDRLDPKSRAAFCYSKSAEYAGRLAIKNH